MHDEPLPHAQEGIGDEEPDEHEARSGFSLSDDFSALLEDGKTYLEAEKAFQKSRLEFVVHKGKRGLFYGLAAFALIHTALIGIVVGAVIALAPIITIWGAIALIGGVLIVSGSILARLALRRFHRAAESFRDQR